MLANVDWQAVLFAGPTILSIAALSMVGLLLNISGLELAIGRDIEVNAELRSSGIANLLSGAVGGPSGYVGLTMTVLAERTGVRGRGAGVATALAMILGLAAAGGLIFQVPVFLTAGFVLFLGIGLLMEWLVATRRELPVIEWLIVVVILLAIALIGFLQGLAVGLLVSIAVFVFNYSRLPVVRLNTSGIEHRSSVDRSVPGIQAAQPARRRDRDRAVARLSVFRLGGPNGELCPPQVACAERDAAAFHWCSISGMSAVSIQLRPAAFSRSAA